MQTKTVSLRPWQRHDAQALATIANNKKIWNNVRDQLPNPYTVSDALQWINHCKKQNPLVNFAILYGNEIAGSIGCVPKEDIAKKTMEIGYFIGEHFQGKGVATEAVRAEHDLLADLFNTIDKTLFEAKLLKGSK